MIHIEINPSLQVVPSLESLEHAALETLTHQAVDGDLTLVVTDDAQLQAMNRTYLDTDSSTDVLSFPASETNPETGRPYQGDILLSLPRAEEQARLAGHTLDAELQLLVVHGTLHLLGHDHDEPGDKTRMWTAQSEILEKLGLGNIQIPE